MSASRLRIAFLTTEFAREGAPDGGLANYLVKTTHLLKARGHQPVVFLLGQRRRRYVCDGIAVIECPRRKTLVRWMPRFGPYLSAFVQQRSNAGQVAKAFLQEHRRAAFDIVQAASYRAIGGALAGVCPVPLVVRASSYAPLLRAASGFSRTLDQHLTDWLEIRQMLLADAVFAPSCLLANLLRRMEGLGVEVLRTPFFLPETAEDASLYDAHLAGKRYLLFFGTHNRLKGVDLLADCLPSLLEGYPALHTVFVGRDGRLPGGGSAFDYVRQRARGFEDRVHLFGSQPRERLLPIVRHAELVILPSRIDNYPNTCLEAQALGKIVVGTRESSLDEMIEDGVTGFLSDQSASALEATIRRALELETSQHARMVAAIEALRAARNPTNDIDALVNLYERTIAGFRARRENGV